MIVGQAKEFAVRVGSDSQGDDAVFTEHIVTGEEGLLHLQGGVDTTVHGLTILPFAEVSAIDGLFPGDGYQLLISSARLCCAADKR